jgi:hypothetical protein
MAEKKKYTTEELKNIERACYLTEKLDMKLTRFCKNYRVKPEDVIVQLREVKELF